MQIFVQKYNEWHNFFMNLPHKVMLGSFLNLNDLRTEKNDI